MDEVLLEQGLKATGLKTRKDLVNHALAQLVRREKQTGLLGLRGKVKWEGNLKAMREGGSRIEG